ncbi:MAG: hypothetical protein QNL90_11285 [Gammaproteobacteria bacterium]|jgi:hypothetical protein|nr:hypothetical protein [Gammaproteobacteria bacterium]MDX2460687.1 hypothetical protein [Gammaproteobacteria bacterium]
MSRRIVRLLVTTMAVGFIVVGSGCASEDDIFKLRVEAKEAKGAAERAEVAANDADSKANASLRLSAEALNAAEAAYACCRANTEKRTRAESKLGG